MNPILITGFHRSGTSAVARQLQAAGLDLGDNLLGAEPANPYGHFEDLDVIAMHDDALAAQGLTWKSLIPVDRMSPHGIEVQQRTLEGIGNIVDARERAGARTWGIKDPRLCLFLPEWRSVVPNCKVIVVMRRPGDAVLSLHRRHARRSVDTRRRDPSDLSFWNVPDLAVKLWIHYHEQLLRSLPPTSDVHIVDFANRTEIESLPTTLAQRWNIPFEPVPLALDDRLGATGSSSIEVRDPALILHAGELWKSMLAVRSVET